MNPRTDISLTMSVKDLIRDKTLLQLQETVRGRKDLEKIFINCSKMISDLDKKTESSLSLAVAIKYHREIFDYDLIIDCILEAIGPARLTEEMKQWCPFPFTDDGVAFKIYKERRFNTIAETSREVTDQELSMILGGMVKDITPSGDYSEVTQGNTTYYFTPMQANAVRYMHERHRKGKAIIYQQDILVHVKSGSEYLKDLFKDNSAWRTLIVKAKNNYYKLDIV